MKKLLCLLLVLAALLTVVSAKETEKTWLVEELDLEMTLPAELDVEVLDGADGVYLEFSDSTLNFEKNKKLFQGKVFVQESELGGNLISFSPLYEDRTVYMKDLLRTYYGFLGIGGSNLKFENYKNDQTAYLKTTVKYKSKGVWVTDTTYSTEMNGLTYLFRFSTAGVQKSKIVETVMKQVMLEQSTWSSTGFDDVTGHWAQAAIEKAVEKELFSGTSDTTFSPDGSMTRAMLVQVLYRMDGAPKVKTTDEFSDVSDEHWFAKSVAWASDNEIVQGYNGKFDPNGQVTREQLAAILWRFAKYQKKDVSVGEETNILSYEDAFDIAEYAIPAFQWTCGAGLMSGVDEGVLAPQNTTTRAEVATILVRYLDLK